MNYRGYEICLAGGRYTVFGPDGVRVGSFNDAPAARRWVRESIAAAKRVKGSSKDAT